MAKLTQAELALKRALEADTDNYDNYFNHLDNADVPQAQVPTPVSSGKPELTRSKYNPAFKAQFDITVQIKYYQEAAGVFTARTAAQMDAALPGLMDKFAFFLFGVNDYAAGYNRMNAEFPISGGWVLGVPFIFGKDYPITAVGVIDATVSGTLQKGDVCLPYTLTSGGNDYLALVIIHCNNTPYSSLLTSTNSDKFVLNLIRYSVAEAYTDQFNNDIAVINQSLFGKRTSDTFSPISFKNPEQNQNGIVDVPIKMGVDKQVALGSYVDYDKVLLKLSVFVWTVAKV